MERHNVFRSCNNLPLLGAEYLPFFWGAVFYGETDSSQTFLPVLDDLKLYVYLTEPGVLRSSILLINEAEMTQYDTDYA